jgi:hypothetical protein
LGKLFRGCRAIRLQRRNPKTFMVPAASAAEPLNHGDSLTRLRQPSVAGALDRFQRVRWMIAPEGKSA